ncbi:hypothetical protein [Fiji disease virus]|uniref:Uncharacterized protein VP4 n=1 Tax=Fiji disease virus (isolate Sugarcane) TaxID=648172 RepID=VP4_FDVS|nr:hypothetical protein [Fiji disease virus]Q9YX47.1 RecName: Full=Uncharacterized protein VP4 [Fiji disease virus isolate Sugarcane]AAD02491.1 unknown [Fiji disease virus]
MLNVNANSLIYPFSGQITDIRKNQFIPTSKFINTVINEPIFLTKQKVRTKPGTSHAPRKILEVNPSWNNTFFNWNTALRNPSTVLPSFIYERTESSTSKKSHDQETNQVLINAEILNRKLPQFIKQKFGYIDKRKGGYVNQFGFWALLYSEFCLKLNVPIEYYISMLNLKTQDNNIFLREYNEVEYALRYLVRFDELIYTNGKGRKFIKLPSSGKLDFSVDVEEIENVIGCDLHYWTLWPLSNTYTVQGSGILNHGNIVRGICEFTNELVAAHYYPTYFYEHYLYFEDVSNLIKHQIYNVIRTYKAQLKLQDNLGTNRLERRGYYLTMFCPFFEKYKYSVVDQFGELYLYLNMFGALPFDSADSKSIPKTYNDFDIYYQDRFKNFKDFGYVTYNTTIPNEYKRRNLGPYQLFFTYQQMFDLIQTISTNVNLMYNFKILGFNMMDISNINEIDTNVTSVCRNIEYPLGPSLHLNNLEAIPPNLLELANNVTMQFNSNFLSPYSMYTLPLMRSSAERLIQEDGLRLAVFRLSTAHRKQLKTLQKQVLDPKVLFDRFIRPNLIRCQIPKFEFLFWITYCVDEFPMYTISSTGDLDVTPLTSSDEKRKSSVTNNSSFKLLCMAFQFLSEFGIREIVKPNSVLFLGAKNEPVGDMLRRLSHGLWSVQRVGADAEYPSKKANINNVNLKNTYDLVISDMDQSTGTTVEAISALCVSQLKKCIECFNRRLVFKIQYGLFHTLCAIRDCLIECGQDYAGQNLYFNMKIVRSCWSKVGSMELFLILDKTKTEHELYTVDQLRAVVNSFGFSETNTVFYTYMGTPSRYQLNDLNCKIFSVDVTVNEFSDVLSTFMNLSNCVSYGALKNEAYVDTLTIFGATNIQRIGLFMRNKQIYKSLALDGKDHRPEGIFDPRKCFVIPGAREVLILSDAQRMKAWKILKKMHFDRAVLDTSLTIYDIGCRDFECAYLAVMDEDTILPYVGIDKSTILDVKRNLTIERREVNRTELYRLATLGHVFVYNSYFMDFPTRAKLEEELNYLYDNLVLKGVMLMSFYCLHDELLPVLKDHGFVDISSKDVKENKFSFGRYHGFGTVDYNFMLEWLTKMSQKFEVHTVILSASDISFSCVMHGNAINLDSIYFAPIFNMVQPCFLIKNK